MGLSRQGRRLSGPVPRWVGGLGAFILLGYAAVPAQHSNGLQSSEVTYEIGVTGRADVELTLPGAEHPQRTRIAAPLRRDFIVHGGDRVSVIATGVGGVLVSCHLRIDGRLVAANTGQSTGCGATIGEPATYVPSTSGEVFNVPAQLGGVMKLPRYSGRSSPVNGRLTDRAAGISYARLSGGWGPQSPDRGPTYASKFTLLRDSRPERGWLAMYGSGLMDPELLYRYEGDGGLFQAALAQQDALTAIPSSDTTYRDMVSQPLTIDGRKAWVITRWIGFGPKASTANIRSELHTLVLIDIGRERPAFLFVSMPDPSHDYLPDVNRLISSIRVL
ncbi:hypothetical protein N5079_27140 [Planotetraspora sp. A-T 1434]|uniref:hypothetical protein n=1 Tax=Planotetraspora sp. A-T 1434 TaxID=2979219 RepID=UPI0021C16A59|nr:hypothetical protein [Planotetraspora sp. A-T 1434]MCT9933893.1 hypothetical protein [Planotetraspora sp. A-T 1434]